MKKPLWRAAMLTMIVCSIQICHSVTLEWDHSPSLGVTNYRVYWSTNKSGPYTNYVQVGFVTTATINDTNFSKGTTNWFIATALDLNSNPIRESVPTTNDCYRVIVDGIPSVVKNNRILEYIP